MIWVLMSLSCCSLSVSVLFGRLALAQLCSLWERASGVCEVWASADRLLSVSNEHVAVPGNSCWDATRMTKTKHNRMRNQRSRMNSELKNTWVSLITAQQQKPWTQTSQQNLNQLDCAGNISSYISNTLITLHKSSRRLDRCTSSLIIQLQQPFALQQS